MGGPDLIDSVLGDLEDHISHYGVKGMRWGVRRKSTGAPAHGDAKKAKRVIDRVKVGRSTDVASNRDLQLAIQRLNLEQQYNRLRPRSTSEKAKKWVAETLLGIGKDEVSKFARDQASQAVADGLKKSK